LSRPKQALGFADKQVEVLVEMAAQSQSKQGNVNLYTPLAVVEAVKCVLLSFCMLFAGLVALVIQPLVLAGLC